MKYVGRKSLSLIAGAILSANAMADAEYTFKLHHMLPPMAMAHSQFIEPWVEKVEAESNGRIEIEIYPAMQLGGKPNQLFDQVRKGIVDITWTVTGYTPGRFPKSTVFELPFIPGSAKATSMALQEYAETEMQDEMKDVHLRSMHTHAPGSLHSRSKEIKTLEDLDGMKVRAPNKIMNDAFRSLGANTTFMPVTEMPSAISKGVLDVAVLPYEVVLPMKIDELVDYHTEFKGDRGLYTNTFIFAMNKDVYADLPDDLKKVIDDNSGLSLAGHLGTLWDNYEYVGRQHAVGEGNTFDTIEGAEYDRWKAKLAPIVDEWVEDMNDDDYDGQRLLDKARNLVNKYEAM